MEIIQLAKNRLILRHGRKELRVEVSPLTDEGFRIYFDPTARLKMPRKLVGSKRKMVIK